MAVTTQDLKTPEDQAPPLATREETTGRKVAGPGPAAAELRRLRDRIEAAKARRDFPPPAAAHCRDCATKGFRAGWEAALEALAETD